MFSFFLFFLYAFHFFAGIRFEVVVFLLYYFSKAKGEFRKGEINKEKGEGEE